MLAGPTTGPSNAITTYIGPTASANTASWTTTEANVRCPVAAAGTISDLKVRVGTAISSGSYAFTMRKGSSGGAMADTTLTVTNDSSNQIATDSTHSFSVVEGDELTIKCVPTSTPTAQGVVQISFLFTSTTTGESLLFQFIGSTGAPGYASLGTAFSSWGATEITNIQAPMPTAGTFTKMYVYLSAAPGVGNSWTFALRVNGADAGTVTISGTSTTGNASFTTAVSAGDLVCLASTYTGTPASTRHGIGLQWKPTTDGESLLFNNWNTTPSTASTVYGCGNGRTVSTETTESNTYNIAPIAFTWKNLYVKMGTAPGAAKSRDVTARLGGASQTLTVNITGAATTTGNDTTHSVSVAAGDLINFQTVPNSTPASSNLGYGSVAYIAPPATGDANGMLLVM